MVYVPLWDVAGPDTLTFVTGRVYCCALVGGATGDGHMRNQQIFEEWDRAIQRGSYAKAAELEEEYGVIDAGYEISVAAYCPAEDEDEARVLRLDTERERYLVLDYGVERWRNVNTGGTLLY